MDSKQQMGISISEGLLPLLDISVLLLGFFIIIITAGAISAEEAAPPAPADLPGIGQIILMRVEDDGQIWISSGDDRGAERVTLENLNQTLKSLRQTQGVEKPLVLIYYENAWSTRIPENIEERIIRKIRLKDFRWARAYP